MADDVVLFDRAAVRRNRRRAARDPKAADFVLERVAADIAERVSLTLRQFERCVIVGAGHGVMTDALSACANVGAVFEADPVVDGFAGRELAGRAFVCDEEALALGNESVDLIIAPLTLHLVNDLPGVLVQMRRALRPDGLVVLSVPGGESLRELRASLLDGEIDARGGASPRVMPSIEIRDLGSLMQRAGFALPVVDHDQFDVGYADALALMRDLRSMGMANPLAARERGLGHRGTLFAAAERYGASFSREDGRISATFDILIATGWAPHESQQKPLAPGSGQVRLADALAGERIDTDKSQE